MQQDRYLMAGVMGYPIMHPSVAERRTLLWGTPQRLFGFAARSEAVSS